MYARGKSNDRKYNDKRGFLTSVRNTFESESFNVPREFMEIFKKLSFVSRNGAQISRETISCRSEEVRE